MNIEVIRRAVLSSALVLLALTASAQTDTTRKDAQSAAAAAARVLAQTEVTKVTPPKPNYWTNSLMTNLNFVQSSFTNWAANRREQPKRHLSVPSAKLYLPD